MMNTQTMKYTFYFALLLFTLKINAQSPYRVFTLDANLKIESEQQTASLVLKALVLNKLEFLSSNKARLKPFNKIDWKKLQKTSDSLAAMIPKTSEFSWEEDYGLKLDGVSKYERWKELTYYYNDFDQKIGAKAIVKGKKTYVLQVKVLIDLNGQIEDIIILKGNKMINRDAQIFSSYNILYKPKKK
jgi:hypothetical protein